MGNEATWGHRNCSKRPNTSLYNGQTRDEGVNQRLDRLFPTESVNFTGIVEGEKLAVPSNWKSNQLQQQFVGVIAKRDRSHVLLVQC